MLPRTLGAATISEIYFGICSKWRPRPSRLFGHEPIIAKFRDHHRGVCVRGDRAEERFRRPPGAGIARRGFSNRPRRIRGRYRSKWLWKDHLAADVRCARWAHRGYFALSWKLDS